MLDYMCLIWGSTNCYRPATKANLGKHSTAIGVPSIIDAANLEEKPKDYYFAVVKEEGEAPPAPKQAKKVLAPNVLQIDVVRVCDLAF